MRDTEGKFFCDFCQKSQDEVGKIIQNYDKYAICDECLALCFEILEEELNQLPHKLRLLAVSNG